MQVMAPVSEPIMREVPSVASCFRWVNDGHRHGRRSTPRTALNTAQSQSPTPQPWAQAPHSPSPHKGFFNTWRGNGPKPWSVRGVGVRGRRPPLASPDPYMLRACKPWGLPSGGVRGPAPPLWQAPCVCNGSTPRSVLVGGYGVPRHTYGTTPAGNGEGIPPGSLVRWAKEGKTPSGACGVTPSETGDVLGSRRWAWCRQ